MSDESASYFSSDAPPQTWSNLGPFQPLSLDMLRAAYQRLTICALCGRRVEERAVVLWVGDRIHRRVRAVIAVQVAPG